MRNDRKMRKEVREQAALAAIRTHGDPSRMGSLTKEEMANEALEYAEAWEYADTDERRSIVANAYYFLGQWIQNNLPVLRVDDDIMLLAQEQMDAAAQEWIDGTYRYPYDAVLIEFVPPSEDMFLSSGDGGFATHLAVVDLSSEGAGNLLLYTTVGLKESSLAWEVDGFVKVDDRAIKRYQMFGFDSEDAVTAVAAFGVPYLIASGLYRRHRQGPARPRSRKKKGKLITPTVWTMDVPVATRRRIEEEEREAERRGPQGRRAPMSQHVVRGHWREQAHGPRWSLRKRLWVRPHWRGLESEERVSKTKKLNPWDL